MSHIVELRRRLLIAIMVMSMGASSLVALEFLAPHVYDDITADQ